MHINIKKVVKGTFAVLQFLMQALSMYDLKNNNR